MRLHDVTPGKNRFCGPAAVSAITGRPVDEVVRVFHAKTPRTRVMGTYFGDVSAVLSEYGLSARPHAIYDYASKPTLAKWLRLAKADRTAGRVFLLSAGHHWVVVSGRRIVCGYTLKVVSVREYPKRRMRVSRVWEVVENGNPRLRSMPECAKALVEERKARARASARKSSRLAKARAQAKAHGIEIEREEDHWLVWPPAGFSEHDGDGKPDDPYEGDHLAWDAAEVEERVATYDRLISTSVS
jgi:hypothetical protein